MVQLKKEDSESLKVLDESGEGERVCVGGAVKERELARVWEGPGDVSSRGNFWFRREARLASVFGLYACWFVNLLLLNVLI